MPGDFDERAAELAEHVGHGTLRGTVEVDQIYARFQELRLDLRHPRGGQAKYLETALLGSVDSNMRRLADAVPDGDLAAAMAEAMEHVADQVAVLAPTETGALRDSAHPTVTSGGATVYDRPPGTGRLDR